jgi:hypothetical protein
MSDCCDPCVMLSGACTVLSVLTPEKYLIMAPFPVILLIPE